MITTSTIITDGVRGVAMQFSGVYDAVGQEQNVVKVDVTALSPACVRIAIKRLTYEVSGGILQLSWDADDPIVFDNLAGQSGLRDYRKTGAIEPPRATLGVTGNLLFSTIGFDVGSSYSVMLEMIKNYD